MFLVPLSSPGIEIRGMRTVDGRPYEHRVLQRRPRRRQVRLGEVNGGWTVLQEPLNAEHGASRAFRMGSRRVDHDATGRIHGRKRSTRWRAALPRRIRTATVCLDDRSVAYRLGRSIARWRLPPPRRAIFGRVAIAQTCVIFPGLDGHSRSRIGAAVRHRRVRRRRSTEYCTASRLVGASTEALSRCFRNMIAYRFQVGRPNHLPPAAKTGP